MDHMCDCEIPIGLELMGNMIPIVVHTHKVISSIVRIEYAERRTHIHSVITWMDLEERVCIKAQQDL